MLETTDQELGKTSHILFSDNYSKKWILCDETEVKMYYVIE